MNKDELIKTIKKTLGNVVAFHRVFVKITGKVDAGLFLSQCLYWSSKTDNPDGWFYKTRSEWEDETGLSRYEQEQSRKILKSLGLLEEKLAGIPARNYYRLNLEKLYQMIQQETGTQIQENIEEDKQIQEDAKQVQYAKNSPTSMLVFSQEDGQFSSTQSVSLPPTIKGINIDYTENTTEIKDCAEKNFSAQSPSSQNEHKKPSFQAGIDWVIGHDNQPNEWVLEDDIDAKKSAFSEHLIKTGKNHLLNYATAFIDATGLIPIKKDYRAWTSAFEYLHQKRATTEEIFSAVNYAKKNGIVISSPFSIRNLVKAVGVQPKKTVITRY